MAHPGVVGGPQEGIGEVDPPVVFAGHEWSFAVDGQEGRVMMYSLTSQRPSGV
jgi:hypothetical protein